MAKLSYLQQKRDLLERLEMADKTLDIYRKNERELKKQISRLLNQVEENKAEIEMLKIEKLFAEKKLKELELKIQKDNIMRTQAEQKEQKYNKKKQIELGRLCACISPLYSPSTGFFTPPYEPLSPPLGGIADK